MSAREAELPRRRGSGFVRAMLPGVELGLVVAIFFIVIATQRPVTQAAQSTKSTSARVDLEPEVSRTGQGSTPTDQAAAEAAPALRVQATADGTPIYRLDGSALPLQALPAHLRGLKGYVRLEIDPQIRYAHVLPLLVMLGEARIAPLVAADAPPTGENG